MNPRRLWVVLPIALLLAVLLAAALLVGDAEVDRSRYAAWTPWLGAVALAAVISLLAVLAEALRRLWRDAAEGVAGARLARRLFVLMVAIGLPPALLVFGFALRFVAVSVDSFFTVEIEQTAEDALRLGRITLDDERAGAVARTAALAVRLEQGAPAGASMDEALAGVPPAGQWLLVGDDGSVRELAAAEPRFLEPMLPDAVLLRQVRDSGDYSAIEPLGEGLMVRVLHRMGGGRGALQGLFPLAADVGSTTHRLEQNYRDYQRLRFLRPALKLSFGLILGLVLLLAVLLALWLSLNAARRAVAPVVELARTADAIAGGELGREAAVAGGDELGDLAAAFNRMSRDLAGAHQRDSERTAAIDAQREHLDTILANLSSGVVAIGTDGRVSAANRAAIEMLDLALPEGAALADLAVAQPSLRALFERWREHAAQGIAQWREEFEVEVGGRARRLLVRGVTPRGGAEHLLLFDDQTELIRAQRDAAWAEVAQRLAHEVKNPLTPIQLGAERLRHRLGGKLAADDAAVLERATASIVHQVGALKAMVDAFSDYARGERLARQPVDLAALIADVAALYEQAGQAEFERAIAADLTPVQADPGRLRQLLHNLLTNAIEAGSGPARIRVELAAAVATDGRPAVRMVVADRGPGLPEGFDARWFEPYVSTKSRGSGLGLAIVKKVVDELGGSVEAGNRAEGGAEFVVVLPCGEGSRTQGPGPGATGASV